MDGARDGCVPVGGGRRMDGGGWMAPTNYGFSFAFLPRGGLGGTETVSRVKRLVVTLSMGFLSFAPPQALSPVEGLGKGSARVGPRGGIWPLLGIILSAARMVVHGVPKEFNLPNALATPMPMFE